jgi:multidrug efflux pump subunit AcrA (membrane-fusion protein)
VVAEIDGVVTRRNVNSGNNVVTGQSLMALRSLTDIWVDANFKETQLPSLRIGRAVDVYVDMYGRRPWQVVWPRVVVIAGLSMIFAPLNVAAFFYIPKELRGAAVGLLVLLRNEGGSVGTSVAQTILNRREQFHVLRLNKNLDPLNSAVQQLLEQSQALFLQGTGDVPLSRQLALEGLERLRQQQALGLAYFDIFWVLAAVALLLVLLVLLMRRSVAEKGTHDRVPYREIKRSIQAD